MTRVRSAAQRAPQTKDQALVLASRFAATSADLALIAADRAGRHAAIDAECDAQAVPLAAEQADIVKQLKPWFAANMDQLTGGKRKSIELGGCLLGYRVNPPAVNFAGGKDDDAVDTLRSAELLDLVRTGKASPDKPAILTLLQLPPAAAEAEADAEPDPRLTAQAKLVELGFSVRQPEVFFVDVAGKDETVPTTVSSDDEVR